MERIDGRKPNEKRPVIISKDYLPNADGSVYIKVGNTWLVCTASIEEKVPNWLKEEGHGWITAEYGMLPRSTFSRTPREISQGRVGGRTQEIQRMIGRSLRAVVDIRKLPEITIVLDCDVIRADGGTRTAAVTGSFIALYDALKKLVEVGKIEQIPISDYVAGISVGIIEKTPLLDLCYEEDLKAEVDMNIIMTGRGRLVEIQGTAEGYPFSKKELDELLKLGEKGIQEVIEIQKNILGVEF
jgi:ribonuclease PH